MVMLGKFFAEREDGKRRMNKRDGMWLLNRVTEGRGERKEG